jgi:hypothetical protein
LVSFTTWVAGRIYRVGILMHGQKLITGYGEVVYDEGLIKTGYHDAHSTRPLYLNLNHLTKPSV